MKYLLIAALLLAFGAFGKLIGSGVGPAEDERRAKAAVDAWERDVLGKMPKKKQAAD